jgi:ABC-2 type transport system ATP-binding protein
VSDAGAAIAVRGLRKSYAGRAAVAGIDLDVATGSIVALLGPNGAGKTTTVEIIEGYRRADAGEIRVLGLDPWRDARALRGRVGLMLQADGIYPQARPGEILDLFARFYRDPIDPRALLEAVGLADSARVPYRVLSGGQRQRLGLALAIVGRPELVILDEPTAGMDPAAKTATRALVGSLRDAGASILLTTHELADAERLADRIAIVDRGRIVAEGTPDELTGAVPRLRVRVARPLTDGDRLGLESVLQSGRSAAVAVRVVDDGGAGRYRVDGQEAGPELIAALSAWCAENGVHIVELRAGGSTLEERYLELTGEPGADQP